MLVDSMSESSHVNGHHPAHRGFSSSKLTKRIVVASTVGLLILRNFPTSEAAANPRTFEVPFCKGMIFVLSVLGMVGTVAWWSAFARPVHGQKTSSLGV